MGITPLGPMKTFEDQVNFRLYFVHAKECISPTPTVPSCSKLTDPIIMVIQSGRKLQMWPSHDHWSQDNRRLN